MIDESHINQLIEIESQVNYNSPPPFERHSFIVQIRKSPVLISAPHGTISLRKNANEKWHEEDEYTAGMAILLGELTYSSVIANIWLTPDSDPNYHLECCSHYKQKIREIVNQQNIKYVIDLHGAKIDTNFRDKNRLIDLGTRKSKKSLDPQLVDFLKNEINKQFKDDNIVNENGFPASRTDGQMSITAFCHEILKIEAIQIEMKPIVRIPFQKINSSALSKGIIHDLNKERVKQMLQSLTNFIEHLKNI
jgi:hypothetical protein